MGFPPRIRGKRPNVLCFAALHVRAAQPRMFFCSPRSKRASEAVLSALRGSLRFRKIARIRNLFFKASKQY